MSEKDFGISVTGIPQVGKVSKKPSYLIILDTAVSKSKTMKYFITVDKPDLLSGFIQVKGLYTDLEEDDISKSFIDFIEKAPKESIVDIMFPWHRVHSIRSLVFNAVKPATIAR